MIEAKNVGLEEARRIVDAAFKYATTQKPGRPIAVAVLDTTRTIVCMAKQDGAFPNNVNMAFNKAWTCLHFGLDTRGVRDVLVTGFGYDIYYFGEPGKLAPIPGGVLLRAGDGTIIGAVGASGRPADEDEEIVFAAIKTAQIN